MEQILRDGLTALGLPTEGVPASEWLSTASVSEIASVLRDVDTATLSLEDIIKVALRRFSER